MLFDIDEKLSNMDLPLGHSKTRTPLAICSRHYYLFVYSDFLQYPILINSISYEFPSLFSCEWELVDANNLDSSYGHAIIKIMGVSTTTQCTRKVSALFSVAIASKPIYTAWNAAYVYGRQHVLKNACIFNNKCRSHTTFAWRASLLVNVKNILFFPHWRNMRVNSSYDLEARFFVSIPTGSDELHIFPLFFSASTEVCP